jgi:kynureninase
MAHQNPFAFDGTEMDYTSGSYRFLTGTTAIPALYTCQAGLDIIAEVGIENIRKRSLDMTKLLINAAKEKGWPLMTLEKSEERGGTVSINIPEAQAIERELLKRNFLVDYRPRAGIRVSPHFYNTDSEIDDLTAAISEISSQLQARS